MTKISPNSGGSAMAGGQRYQAEVTAWWMVRILLQSDVSSIYKLSSATIPAQVSSETTDAIDDLRIDLQNEFKIFGQCKRRINLSFKQNGEFASVIKQFYQETERPGDIKKKVFVLYFEENNGNLLALQKLLNRFRNLKPDKALIDAAINREEQEIVNKLEALLDLIQKEKDFKKLKNNRNTILRQMFIYQLELNNSSSNNLNLTESLQHLLIKDPAKSNLALKVLHRLADDLMADRESRNALTLRQELNRNGIELQDAINYRSDFDKLERWTSTELTTHEAEGRTKLKIGNNQLTIKRPVVESILKAVETDSFLVIGNAGIGKTGCLHATATQLINNGKRVWYWAADSLPYNSVQEIGTHLQINNNWMGIFAEATTTRETYLIIDGLDGVRDTQVQKAYRDLISLAIRSGVKVIASIRKFDLYSAVELSDTFATKNKLPDPKYSDPAFQNIKHISIKELDVNEFRQILAQLLQLKNILRKSPELLKVVINLFSLELLCKLIDDKETPEQLSTISTQAQLFDRFWKNRIDTSANKMSLVLALESLVNKMVIEQSLQAVPESGNWSDEVKTILFSNGILRNPPPLPGRIPEENLVEFSHHLMFDYVAERLYVRQRKNNLINELKAPQNWSLFLRPSVVLFFRYLWAEGRLDYWDTIKLLQKSGIKILQMIPAFLVAAQEINLLADFEPMFAEIDKNEEEAKVWININFQIISAATFSPLPELFSKGDGNCWLGFALKLIQTKSLPFIFMSNLILQSASNSFENLNPEAKAIFAKAILELNKYELDKSSPDEYLKFAVKWVCQTISLNPTENKEIIRRLISKKELERLGFITASEIASQVDKIWDIDPEMAVEIYDSLFGHIEASNSQISLSGSQILNLTMSRGQLFQSSHFALVEKFSNFLNKHPAQATQALILVLRHFRNQQAENFIQPELLKIIEFEFDGMKCRLCQVKERYFSNYFGDRHEDDDKVLLDWKTFLENIPDSDNPNEQFNIIKQILVADNDIDRLWMTLLEVGSKKPAFYATRLWSLLTNSSVLLNSTLYQAAEDCITEFAPFLSESNRSQIEEAIFAIENDELKYQSVKLFLRFPQKFRSIRVKDFLKTCSRKILNWSKPIKRDTSEKVFQRMEPEPSESENLQEIYRLSSSLASFNDKELLPEEISQIFQNLEEFETRIQEFNIPEKKDIFDSFQERIIGCLRWFVVCDLPLEDKILAKSRKYFVERLNTPQFEPNENELNNFDRRQSWNPENGLTNAVEGFICLIEKQPEISEEDEKILQYIVDNPKPVIRYIAGGSFYRLLNNAEDFVWKMLAQWKSQIPIKPGTQGVLNGTLHDTLIWKLRFLNEEKTDQFFQELLEISKISKAETILTKCGNYLAILGILEDIEWAKDKINNELENIPQNYSQLIGIIQITSPLYFKEKTEPGVTDEKRTRSLEFIKKFLNSLGESLNQYLAETQQNRTNNADQEEAPIWVKEGFRFFEQYARQIEQSVKEIFKNQKGVEKNELIRQANLWWLDMEPLFEELLKVPFPQFMYHLIEAIEQVMLFNVEKGLYWLHRVVIESTPNGLTIETFVADKVIEMLESVLTDYKVSLKNNSELQTNFIDILEAFLNIGHIRSFQLAYRIESIFR